MFLSIDEKILRKLLYFTIFFILFFILIYFKNFFFREKIIFSNWNERSYITTKNDYFSLRGKAFHIKKISVNKKEFFLNQDNKFEIPLFLFSGENIFYFLALSESGKKIEKEIIIFRE